MNGIKSYIYYITTLFVVLKAAGLFAGLDFKWEVFVCFVGAAVVALLRGAKVKDESGIKGIELFSLDYVVVLSLLFWKGWPYAVMVTVCARLVYWIYCWVRLGRNWYRGNWFHDLTSSAAMIGVIYFTGIILRSMMQLAQAEGGGKEQVIRFSVVAITGLGWFGVCVFFEWIRQHVYLNIGLRKSLRNFICYLRSRSVYFMMQALMVYSLACVLWIFLLNSSPAALLLYVPVTLMHSAWEARSKLLQESSRTIEALANYLEERDPYTMGHSRRVSEYAAKTALEMGLPSWEVELVRRAGLIHDIGKVDVPDAVLRKPGKLTAFERKIMNTHVDRALSLADKLVALRSDLPFHLAAYHHEHYDGTGKFGLQGEEIPLASRILAVVDAYDAMTSDRPYRKGMEPHEALFRLLRAQSTQFDPKVVAAFVRFYKREIAPGVLTQDSSFGHLGAHKFAVVI